MTPFSSFQYSFDNVGNVTNKTTEQGNTAYSYDLKYQLTDSVSLSSQEPFTYDAAGNRLTDTSTPAGLTFGTTQFYYNARNRLERVTLPDGRVAAYTYDPFGRRIKKTITPPPPAGGGVGEGIVTFYAYSDEGLIGEYSAAGNLIKAYGWKPNSTWGTDPVFMVENGSYYFYHNDHLGTPQRLTDINGNTIWSATYTAFGEATVNSASVVNNLRFPGQYYDEETGLHYNWNRYYNPKTGRYTQEDPIGFASNDENLYRAVDSVGKPLTETNLYLYTANSPVNRIDPIGLDWITDFTNFSAGLGDALLFDTGQYLRDQLGIEGVDMCSNAYKYGAWASFAFGAARLSYAGLAKWASIAAKSGIEASAFRGSLKKFFRLGFGANFRSPNLAKYGTDDALRDAAGRTNPYLNLYGTGVAASGASGGISCGCGE